MQEQQEFDVFTVFNNKLVDFVDDLGAVLGHLNEYALVASSVKFLAKFQERQNQSVFDAYVVQPYGSYIMNRDESFLMNQGFEQVAAGTNIVSLLKSVWSSLPEGDKSSIWAHMHVMILLNDRCKQQLQRERIE